MLVVPIVLGDLALLENAPGEIDRTPAGPGPVVALPGKGCPWPGPPGALFILIK